MGEVAPLIALTPDAPLDWIDAPVAGGSVDVRLARLHVDERNRASVSLVEFPPGWERTESGHYLAAEEFLVLTGELQLGDERFVAGEYGFTPPSLLRGPTRTPDGALALAWFSGPARWSTDAISFDPGAVVHSRPTKGTLRSTSPDVPGSSEVTDGLEGGSLADTDEDVLDLATARWRFVAAGSPRPAIEGAVFRRNW